MSLTAEQSGPKMMASSPIFMQLPKAYIHPLGENSPNLATLMLN
jgi:hypothetical protein